jgi:hypothetical protein
VAALALLAAACGGASDSKKESGSDPAAAPATSGEQARAIGATAAADQSAAQRQAAAPAPATAGQSQSAAGGQPQGGAQNAQPLPPTADRKLIFNVSLDLIMKDVQDGFERVGQIAEANGGFVADSSFRQEGDQRRASVTIRVPAQRYRDVLDQVRGLAVKVDSEKSSANDVTEEYTDLQARQRNLEATEQQLLVFLGQAKNVQEVLTVQDRLNSTRAEIEKVKGRLNLLGRLTDLATIQMTLRPEPAPVAKEPAPESGPVAALREGWEASLDVVGGIALAVLTVAAFSWWLLPFAALALWLYRREQRRRAIGQVPADTA